MFPQSCTSAVSVKSKHSSIFPGIPVVRSIRSPFSELKSLTSTEKGNSIPCIGTGGRFLPGICPKKKKSSHRLLALLGKFPGCIANSPQWHPKWKSRQSGCYLSARIQPAKQAHRSATAAICELCGLVQPPAWCRPMSTSGVDRINFRGCDVSRHLRKCTQSTVFHDAWPPPISPDNNFPNTQ